MGRQKNKNRKPTESAYYYFVAHIDSKGNATPLLLTEADFKRAKKRAAKNKEDVPMDFIAITQLHKE